MSGFCVVIPARYGSTRLPGKPLRLIAGEIMIARVYARALASAAADVVVATDDERVVRACKERDLEVMMTSASHRSGTDRCAEVARARGWDADTVVVNVQGDEPLLPSRHISAVATALVQGGTDVATLACPIRDRDEFIDPNVVKVVCDDRGRALLFSRAAIPHTRDPNLADAPASQALRHIGLYAYRVSTLEKVATLVPCELEHTEQLEQLRALWHGLSIQVATTQEAPGPGVDTEDDIGRVEAWMAAGGD